MKAPLGSDERELVLAADLGGTRSRVGLVNPAGHVLHRASHRTPAAEGPQAVVGSLVRSLKQLLNHVPRGQFVRGLGVAAPGPLDPREGVVRRAPNLPGWRDVPLKQLLESELGLHVVLGNDANLAALGEWRFGIGRGHQHLVYLTVSTGVGSGVISGGQLVLGKAGLAVEAGHMKIQIDGPVCKCGSRGCLEAFASGTAIANNVQAQLAQGKPSSLSHARGLITADLVAAAAQQGDALAREAVTAAARALGVGVASLIHIFNPSVFILGGGVTQSGPLWWDEVRSTVERHTMPEFLEQVQLVAAALGDDVGLLGAAAAVMDEATAIGGL